ncbi:hypothetical protein K1W54_04055 [Micromonospora sp. CPCC 205371]|nr:hypothetical protein [Micromonospora sp. CPCC 205371]
MSIADDLRTTAITAASVAIAPLLSTDDTLDPTLIAKVAVNTARPFIEDAARVEDLPTERNT